MMYVHGSHIPTISILSCVWLFIYTFVLACVTVDVLIFTLSQKTWLLITLSWTPIVFDWSNYSGSVFSIAVYCHTWWHEAGTLENAFQGHLVCRNMIMLHPCSTLSWNGLAITLSYFLAKRELSGSVDGSNQDGYDGRSFSYPWW